MDHNALAQLETVFSKLNTAVYMLDYNGMSILPRTQERFNLPLMDGDSEFVFAQGRCFLTCPPPANCILMTEAGNRETAQDALTLCRAAMMALIEASGDMDDMNRTLMKLLFDELSPLEKDAALVELHLALEKPRCILLFRILQTHERTAQDLLKEIVPMGCCDILLPLDRHSAALIKDTSGLAGYDEILQFAEALLETAMSEAAITVTIGIGDPVPSIRRIHESYQQAVQAIETGCIYSPKRNIYSYKNMLFERFLSAVPVETANKFHELLFNRTTARLFSDEMLETIDMFLKKDLNLSDTARSLYIHRNTLVYRLDKVERQTGLNLRRFDDAMTFKLLKELKKSTNDINGKNKSGKR